MIRPAIALLAFSKDSEGNYELEGDELKDILILSDEAVLGEEIPELFSLEPLYFTSKKEEADVKAEEDDYEIREISEGENNTLNPIRWEVPAHFYSMFWKCEKRLREDGKIPKSIGQSDEEGAADIKTITTLVIIDEDCVVDEVCLNTKGDKKIWHYKDIIPYEIFSEPNSKRGRRKKGNPIRVFFQDGIHWKENDIVFEDRANYVTAIGMTEFVIKARFDGEEIEKTMPLISHAPEGDEGYMTMIEDLVSIYEDIVLDENGSSGITKVNSWMEELNELEHILLRIEPRAETRLEKVEVRKQYYNIKRFTPKTMYDLVNNPAALARTVDDIETYDIYEHRMILQYLQRIEDFARRKLVGIENTNKNILRSFYALDNDTENRSETDIKKDLIKSYNGWKDKKEVEKNWNAPCGRALKDIKQYVFRFKLKDTLKFADEKTIQGSIGTFGIKNIKNQNGEYEVYEIIGKKDDKDHIKFGIMISNCIWPGKNKKNLAPIYLLSKGEKGDIYDITYLYGENNSRNSRNSRYENEIIKIEKVEMVWNGKRYVESSKIIYNTSEKDPKIDKRVNSLKKDAIKAYEKSYGYEIKRGGFFGEYKNKDIDEFVDKEKQMLALKYKRNEEQILSWKQIFEKIEKLKRLNMLRDITVNEYDTLQSTNLFSNEPNYRKVYDVIKRMPDEFMAMNLDLSNIISITKACNVFEYWCLVKMLWIFVEEYGFFIHEFTDGEKDDKKEYQNNYLKERTKDYIKNIIKEFFKNPNVETFDIRLISSKISSLEIKITYQGELCKKSEKGKKYKPDYILDITYNDKTKRYVLDAKYRDFEKQGTASWYRLLYDVAAYKYFTDAEETIDGSYIIHPYVGNWRIKNEEDKLVDGYQGNRYSSYYGYGTHDIYGGNYLKLLKYISKKYNPQYKEKYSEISGFFSNKKSNYKNTLIEYKKFKRFKDKYPPLLFWSGHIGTVGMQPYNTLYFKNLIRMIMERFVNVDGDAEEQGNKNKDGECNICPPKMCWMCGGSHEEYTKEYSGNGKAYMCKNDECPDKFMIKVYCQNCLGRLFKHRYSTDYREYKSWNNVCPRCGEIYKKIIPEYGHYDINQ